MRILPEHLGDATPARPWTTTRVAMAGWMLAWGTVACSDDAAPASAAHADVADSSDTSTGADVSGADLGSDSFDSAAPGQDIASADAALSCPGGPGCGCAANSDCDNALCIDTPDGRRCAVNCSTSCPSGFKCVQTPVSAGDVATICVPTWGKLCNPCLSSQSCSALGQGSASCVVHGPAGAYCGADCMVDSDCPGDFFCSELPTIEGTKARQCVPKGAAGAVGACTCSKAAMAAQLSTSCVATAVEGGGGCPGQRSCGASGLSPCSAAAFGKEVCDGLDNDCDGATDETSCDDGNPCTVDLCAPATVTGGAGACSHAPSQGAPCNADNNPCTESDVCIGGQCAPGAAKNCNDNNPCTADACTLAQGCTHTSQDGVGCDDENPCTVGDVCGQSGCLPGKSKTCPVDQPCAVGKCDLSSGKCGYADAQDGLLCDDGTLCTDKDACLAGACKGQIANCDDANPCTNDGCDAKTGCSHTPASAFCTDNNACTDADHCDGGACVTLPKGPTACDDVNPCTADTCDVALGCVHTATDGSCDDGDVCTSGDACVAGLCKPGALTCPCQKDSDCATKEDGDLCNGTLVCKVLTTGKVCAVDPKTIVACSAAADTLCLINSCDPLDGVCKPKAEADGKPCDADASVCTPGDACSAGLCKTGKPIDCNDKNGCTNDSCDPLVGCVNTPNTSPCNADSDLCTKGDVCDAKVCVPGPQVVCNDGKDCTTEQCDKSNGACAFATLPKDGSPCDADASACTPGDTCAGGTCVPGKKLNCDDGNACTADSCNPASGCVHAPAAGPCDADGSLCTKSDACAGGVCLVGAAVLCDDGKLCTKDTCSPATGLCTFDVTGGNGTPCDADGSVCTVGDACKGGLCLPGAVSTCDDGDGCTTDACNPKTGCAHAAAKDDTVCAAGKLCKAGVCSDPYACNAGVDTTYGSPANDRAQMVLADATGFTVAAVTEGKIGANPDAWLIRLNTAGKLVWTTTVGGTGTDEIRDVATSSTGWVSAGWTNSKGAGGYDAWLVRTDGAGTVQWELMVGTAANEWARGVASTSAGIVGVGTATESGGPAALYFLADSGGKLQWSKTIAGSNFNDVAAVPGGYVAVGNVVAGSAGASDGMAVKFDAAGNTAWSLSYGGSKAEQLNAVLLLTDGMLLVGETASQGAGDSDIWLIKVDPDGKKLWEKAYGTSAFETGLHAVAVPGGFAVSGYTSSLLSGTGEDLALLRTDLAGNTLTYKTLGGGGDERGNGIAAVKDGFAVAAATSSKGGGLLEVWFLRSDPWFNTACPAVSLCAPISPSDCDDAQACTADWCADAKGCTHTPVPCP